MALPKPGFLRVAWNLAWPYWTGDQKWSARGLLAAVPPGYVAVGSDPFQRVTTFTTGGNVVSTDLILNGTLDKHPDLRIGIVELSAVWVPMFLMMLDGGPRFAEKLNGRPLYKLDMAPSDYFRRQVRVSSFAYELPSRLIKQTGDLYMCCSDYPYSEGTATPLDDYRRIGCEEPAMPGLFHDNVDSLLGR